MARRRRTRYCFTATPPRGVAPQDIDVLAYSEDAARDLLTRRGWSAARKRYSAPRIPSTTARPWRFNRAAIAEAFEAMTGEPLPGNLALVSDRRGSRTLGWFNFQRGRPTIKVRSDLTPERANQTLWHELAHLAQFVRAGSPEAWQQQWKAVRSARYGYMNRPWEREAREWEALAETDFLLTV